MQNKYHRLIVLAFAVVAFALITLIVTNIAQAAKNSPRSAPTSSVLCVDDSLYAPGAPCLNSQTYQTIRAAVQAASTGDEIRIGTGTFTSEVVSKTLSIKGGYPGGVGGFTTNDPVNNSTYIQGITFTANASLGDFFLDGTLGGSATPTLTGRISWISGSITGAGTLTVDPAANLIGYATSVTIDARTVNNQGSFTVSAHNFDLTLNNGAVFNNNNLFNIIVNANASVQLLNTAGTAIFNNNAAGTIRKDSSGFIYFNKPSANLTFNNVGTIRNDTDPILFNEGTFNLQSTTVITGAGAIAAGGTSGMLNIIGTVNTSGYLQLTDGTASNGITGTGTLNIQSGGTLTINGGWMQGTGITNILPGATTNLIGTGGTISRRTFNNQGTFNWTSYNDILFLNDGATFNNQGLLGININANSTVYLYNSSGVGTFNNTSTGIIKEINGNFNYISKPSNNLTFNNSGNLDMNGPGSGLYFNEGTFNMLAGSTTTGTGFAYIGGTTGMWNVAATINVQNLQLDAGSATGGITGTGTLNISGTLNWDGGWMQGSGVTNLQAGGTGNIYGATSTLRVRTFNNHGTITHATNSPFQLNDGGTLNNQGTYLSSFGIFQATSGAGVFNNSGTFTKQISGTSYFQSGITFNNTGNLNVNSYQLEFDIGSTFNQTAGVTDVETGLIANGTTLNFQGGELRGTWIIQGNVNNTGATVSPGSTTGSSNILTIQGNYTQGVSGKLKIELGGSSPGSGYDKLATTGVASITGTLQLSTINGFEPPDNSQYTILTYVSHSGTFGQITGADATATYNSTDVTIIIHGQVPTATNTPIPSNTLVPSNTPTRTLTRTPTIMPTNTSTRTATSSPTSTPCALPSWEYDIPLPSIRADAAVASLGGYLYVAGGTDDANFGEESNNSTPTGPSSGSPEFRLNGAARFDGTHWTQIRTMPIPVESAAGVSDGTNFYVIGGFTATNGQSQVQVYHPATDTWTQTVPPPQSISSAAAVYYEGRIYVFGGCLAYCTPPPGGNPAGNAVLIYNIAANSWSYGADMPQGKVLPMARNIGQFIYVAGGIKSFTYGGAHGIGTEKAYRYNPDTNSWDDNAAADMPASWWGGASAVLNGQMRIYGGVKNDVITDQSLTYDPATNSWTYGPSLKLPTYRTEGDLYQGKLFIVGGFSQSGSYYRITQTEKLVVSACAMPTTSLTPTITPTRANTVTPTPTYSPTRTFTGTRTPSPTPFNYEIIRRQLDHLFYHGTQDSGNHCDNCLTHIQLPFPVYFYDRLFSEGWVSSNGTFAFTHNSTNPSNTCLPNSQFTDVLYPLWDDLTTACSGCGVFTNGSISNGIYSEIIEWRARRLATGGYVNFVIVFYGVPSMHYGLFNFAYGELDGLGISSTVGAQYGTGSSYVQYVCSIPFGSGEQSAPEQPLDDPLMDGTELDFAWLDQEPSPTPTTCALSFSDVPPGSTFYQYVSCLACRGVLGGYSDGTFRPGDNMTRGQLAKVVSNAVGLVEDHTEQSFEDVPAGSTFHQFIERLAARGYVGGYPCGGPGEPCGNTNLPYFRPNSNVTRGQAAKIVASAALLTDTPPTPPFVEVATFTDVPVGSTFYRWIKMMSDQQIVSGYPCGGPGEPCGNANLPYFRPNSNVTRGQAAKIVANTFHPNCTTP